jgi:hypothetical protein
MAYMAVYKKIYEAAKDWAGRCLLDDRSVFDEESIWTSTNIDELVSCYVKNLDTSKRDFMTKLEGQIATASSKCKRLMAEILWAMYLFTSSLKPETKLLKIKRVWDWSGLPFPEGSDRFDVFSPKGIGSTGPAYQNYFWLELSYMIEILAAFKAMDRAGRVRLLADCWSFAEFLDAQDPTKSRQLRHTLAHLLFPETFERISSRGQKRAILLTFSLPYEKQVIDFKDRQSIDKALLALRERLGEEFGPDFDYYTTSGIVEKWLSDVDDDDAVVAPGADIPSKDVKLPDSYANIRFWAIAAGQGAKYWKEFAARRAIAIGLDEFGPELATLDAQSILERLAESREDGTKPTNDALAAREFAQVIKPGDVIFAKKGRSLILGFGRVDSDYRYDPDFPGYHHVRSVDWIKTGEWKLDSDHSLGTKTLTELTSYHSWVVYALGLLGELVSPDVAETRTVGDMPDLSTCQATPYTKAEVLEEFFFDEPTLDDYLGTWKSKKNLIIAGAPGTGKSWLARRLTWLLLGSKDESRILAVQFHQSYSYEDFVRGWKPGPGQFELIDGPFLVFCELARKDPERAYVLLIDEINRGNLSRVFGELFSLIEADKRRSEYAIRLACPRKGESPFFLPDNLYILGTMNSADRSLAVVDYALRRRFAFRKLEPAYGRDEFNNYLSSEKFGVEAAVLARIDESMRKLNTAIADDRNLGPDYRIGHSYFSSLGEDTLADAVWFEGIIRGEIIPLLEEYWFDEPAKVQEWKAKLIPVAIP